MTLHILVSVLSLLLCCVVPIMIAILALTMCVLARTCDNNMARALQEQQHDT